MSSPGLGNTIQLNQLTLQATNEQWRDYPVGIGSHNLLTTPAKSLSHRLNNLSDIVFSDEIDLRIIDVHSEDRTNGKYSDRRE